LIKGIINLVNAYQGKRSQNIIWEAAIAYWHTTPTDENKWQHILQLYNQLILIEYSPVTALNRAFAFARVYGWEKGIGETEKLALNSNSHYYSLLGFLYANTDIDKSIRYYKKAVTLTRSKGGDGDAEEGDWTAGGEERKLLIMRRLFLH